MGLVELFIIAVGLSMDAFAVSICKGLSLGKIKIKHMLLAGIWFGGFQAMMPVIEWDDAGNCTKIAAMPISLGFDTPETKGFPRLADPKTTDALHKKLVACCEPYGTKVTLGEDGMFFFSV